jgi:hypothetical protein
LIDEAMIKDHIEKHIPEKLKKHAHEGLMKCVKLHGKIIIVMLFVNYIILFFLIKTIWIPKTPNVRCTKN